jgi:hypothetical protein
VQARYGPLRVERSVNRRGVKGAPKENDVSTNIYQGSAKIYQFPVGGRAALGGRPTAKPIEVAAAAVNRAPASSGWYHEAALHEGDLPGKPQ